MVQQTSILFLNSWNPISELLKSSFLTLSLPSYELPSRNKADT